MIFASKKIRSFFFLVCIAWQSAAAQEKPNILWITIEDTSPQFVGAYGNPVGHTPTIDHLAKEGVRFTRAFSTGTVCSPSRSAIITGVRTYEAGTGHHRSNYPLPDQIKGFPYYLRQQGYYTTNNSKTDYNTSSARQIIQQAWDESSGKAGWWNRQDGQPFFAVFNFVECHQSRTMTNPYSHYEQTVLNLLKPEEIIADTAFDMPPWYRDSPDMRKQHARVYNSLKLTDNKINALLQQLDSTGLRDETIIFFFADHGEGIPRAKTNGIGLGYQVPFVVWFPEKYKHLSPWGKSGISDELVCFEDLAPTILNLAGADIPEYMKGRVLLGNKRKASPAYMMLSSDRSDCSTEMVRSVVSGRYVYSRVFFPHLPQYRWMKYHDFAEVRQLLRSDYASGLLNSVQSEPFQPRQQEYLYDLDADPWELNNLANNPAYVAQVATMRQFMVNELVKARDVLFIPEYELDSISKKSTPYEYRLLPDYQPEKVINKALATSTTRKSIRKQFQLFGFGDRLERYWVLVGLQSNRNLTPKQLKPIQNALQDSYPPVQIGAALLLYKNNQDEAAKEVLLRHCASENPYVAMQALEGVLYLESGHEPFLTAVERFLQTHEKNPRMENAIELCELILYRRKGRPLVYERYY